MSAAQVLPFLVAFGGVIAAGWIGLTASVHQQRLEATQDALWDLEAAVNRARIDMPAAPKCSCGEEVARLCLTCDTQLPARETA